MTSSQGVWKPRVNTWLTLDVRTRTNQIVPLRFFAAYTNKKTRPRGPQATTLPNHRQSSLGHLVMNTGLCMRLKVNST